ncbi:WhiB family transcriptional regulator [Nocardia sp. NPDC052566]|uniref:WhiB family transcriptional regulator n=1 Tax=Nocardia sp. NPDC052566 TaxID=3364330 RepID=UPI0037CC260F
MTSHLSPVAEAWDWQMYGECRGMNSAVFFHPDRERGSMRAVRIGYAKRICHRCAVLEQCREFALSSGELYGVWGGMSEQERRAEQQRTRDAASTDRAERRVRGRN